MTERRPDGFEALGRLVCAAPPLRGATGERFILFVSHTDGSHRATTFTITAANAALAWQEAVRRLERVTAPIHWLRADWVRAVEETHWGRLRERLARTKRNYFRLGIALDRDFARAFLETELNANAMLYGGPRIAVATVNQGNFKAYAMHRHGADSIDFSDDAPVWLFSTSGAFLDNRGAVHTIEGRGRNAGRRSIIRPEPELLLDLIRAGSRYLASQMQPWGRFHYGWHPCFDRPIGTYNTLRHASTLFAMLEAWDVTRDDLLRGAIERGLDYLAGQLVERLPLPDGGTAAFLVDSGNEIKLGGNAAAILALSRHAELTGCARYRPLLDDLARGVLHMQDAATGRFVHVLHFPSLAVKEPFRIIYYDGEAAFALMRLYRITRDPRLLASVEKAFEHFMASDHAKAHDHWLAYCTAELTAIRPQDRYFRFGLDNIRDYLGFIERRLTTFPTLLELIMAVSGMAAQMRDAGDYGPLLDTIDWQAFDRAMHARAANLMNGHFWPELAMFFARPDRVAGSFFIRHHGFRVRIDDVQHYLSALIAYRNHVIDKST